MRTQPTSAIILFTLVLLGLGSAAAAQTPAPAVLPPPPPPAWSGQFGAGISMTSGNTDSKMFNVSFEVLAHPTSTDTAKFDGLFLRGTKDGELIVSRTTLNARDEHKLGERTFVFGQLGFLKDAFKEIDYLFAPVGGIGYQIVKTDQVTFSVDAGAGGIWEKNTDAESVDFSGAVTAGESASWKVTDTTSVTHSARGLWKMSDFSDALLTFNVGLATTIVENFQLKVDLLNTYKAVVPNDSVEKNDVAIVLTVVYKF